MRVILFIIRCLFWLVINCSSAEKLWNFVEQLEWMERRRLKSAHHFHLSALHPFRRRFWTTIDKQQKSRFLCKFWHCYCSISCFSSMFSLLTKPVALQNVYQFCSNFWFLVNSGIEIFFLIFHEKRLVQSYFSFNSIEIEKFLVKIRSK